MQLSGWRYTVFIGTFVGSIGLYSYVTMLHPMLDPEPYKMIREEISKNSSNKENKSQY